MIMSRERQKVNTTPTAKHLFPIYPDADIYIHVVTGLF